MSPPRATVRLQLHKAFTFEHAQTQVPYFARLGVSHLYLSPIMVARAGSNHGYDVVDHGAVNPELGGEAGLIALVEELRQHGMGLIVDIVPNHMAVGGADNRAWLDLLEWGRDSRFARVFDIDWDVHDPALRNRVHAPFLGKPYGEALQDGEIQLCFDQQQGRFHFAYYEHQFPLAPSSYASLIRLAGEPLSDYSRRFREAVSQARSTRGDQFSAVCSELAAEIRAGGAVAAALTALLSRFAENSDDGRNLLHHLLERQNYRLAWWRTASDEINWRRFFDVINLAGIRVEEPAAFEVVHATLFRLYAEGLIDGVRIDHIDGLADPRTYCRRLRQRLSKLTRERPATAPKGSPYIIVEKILAPGERLAPDWDVDGTTGYAFMNEVGALLHDPAGEEPLTELWTAFSGRHGDFEAEEKAARRRIPQELLAADFNACAHALHRVARSDPATRDWSLFAIRRVLTELLVQFPVYRTYADARGRSEADEQIMQQTVAAASPHCHPVERPLLEAISRWLGGEPPKQVPARARRARLRAIARFQQLSSPVAAKSVEDTAFYRYGVLLSRNEVGASPGRFSMTANEFHEQCRSRGERFPHAMLATATHDHKRGEDLRARLALLSELPVRWAETVQHWRQLNAGHKRHTTDGDWPDAADEYMLYQMLVAAWPPQLALEDASAIGELRDRLAGWQIKALREAKRHSSWLENNPLYEQAAADFLAAVLDPARSRLFLTELYQFVQSIAAAGAVNSLTQTAIRLTTTGVPDLYQGTELWDFSLVDPDNRRPVDYALRHQALITGAAWSELVQNWRDGRIKLRLIATLLELRQRHPEIFASGKYLPLTVEGAAADHIFAYARQVEQGGKQTVVIVAAVRFPGHITEPDRPVVPASHWRDTKVVVPAALQQKGWINVVTGAELGAAAALAADQLFSDTTVAVLETTFAAA